MTSATPDEPHRDVLLRALAAWPRTVLLVVLGGVAGLLIALPRPDVLTEESRLSVGANDLAAYQIAGFAVGAEALAANYARFASDSPTIRSLLTKRIGAATTARIDTITSSPIPDSNVIRVEVSSTDQSAASKAAAAISDYLVSETKDQTSVQQAGLLSEHRTLSLKVIHLQNKLADVQPGTDKDDAEARLANLRVRQTATGVAYQQSLISSPPQSGLQIIQNPALTARSQGRTRELYAVVGAVVGFLVALVVASGRLRVRRRKSRTPIARDRGASPSTPPPAKNRSTGVLVEDVSQPGEREPGRMH